MTEEIIIDGVNVAGCGYYYDTFGHCDLCGIGTDKSDTFCTYCKDNSGCYYKQLQRLKQENDTIREHCKQVDETNKILYQEKCELIQENEKLRETASLYENLYNHHGEVVEWYSKLRNKPTLYCIALEEIREIADKELYLKQNSLLTKIINKINEVLE